MQNQFDFLSRPRFGFANADVERGRRFVFVLLVNQRIIRITQS